MQTKKIFFLANAQSIHTVKWVDYFMQQNYEVYLATFTNTNNTQCKNIYYLANQTMNTKGGNYHYLFSVIKLTKILKEIKPDVINAHYSYSMGLIALLAKERAKINTSLSVVCHGSDILSPPNLFIFDKINSYILNRCDKIFVVSEQIKDKIEQFGVQENKIFVGQYGIDIDIGKEVSKDIDILSNRAYHPNSRIDFLLDSLDSLQEKDLYIVFVLPNITTDDFNIISTKYPHIHFYKKIEHKEMMELMSRAKIYISATKSDGTSLSLLEAMKYKLVPIVSNIISNRSWVADSVNGYLFNNKREFIQKIDKVLHQDNKNITDINTQLLKDKGAYNSQMNKIEIFLMDLF